VVCPISLPNGGWPDIDLEKGQVVLHLALFRLNGNIRVLLDDVGEPMRAEMTEGIDLMPDAAKVAVPTAQEVIQLRVVQRHCKIKTLRNGFERNYL
jgi:hypothetical protein